MRPSLFNCIMHKNDFYAAHTTHRNGFCFLLAMNELFNWNGWKIQGGIPYGFCLNTINALDIYLRVSSAFPSTFKWLKSRNSFLAVCNCQEMRVKHNSIVYETFVLHFFFFVQCAHFQFTLESISLANRSNTHLHILFGIYHFKCHWDNVHACFLVLILMCTIVLSPYALLFSFCFFFFTIIWINWKHRLENDA